MKKKLILLMCLVMVVFVTASCSSNTPKEDSIQDEGKKETGIKTGLAVTSTIDKSLEATAEAEGLAQIDSAVVAVMVDENDKIVKCIIDGVQTKINFTPVGTILTPLDTFFQTKNELGKEYGMNKASSIGKEWNEEAAALAEYVTGKTIDEVKSIKLTETGVPTDIELSASVTFKIGGTLKTIEKAVANAEDVGAKADDTLGLGIMTDIAKSVDATQGESGLAQAYSTYTLTTFASDKTVTSCILEGTQSNVNFDNTGKLTSDLKAEIKTKNELGDAYGLKKASAIGKEWNEQAKAYAAYAKGKTLAELKGIAITEDGAPIDKELSASVTISVGVFNDVIEKASKTLK